MTQEHKMIPQVGGAECVGNKFVGIDLCIGHKYGITISWQQGSLSVRRLRYVYYPSPVVVARVYACEWR